VLQASSRNRSFILSGKSEYLADDNRAVAEIPGSHEKIGQLTADNPEFADIAVQGVNVKLELKRCDGAPIITNISTAALWDASGNLYGAILTLVDLTVSRALQAQRQQSQKMGKWMPNLPLASPMISIICLESLYPISICSNPECRGQFCRRTGERRAQVQLFRRCAHRYHTGGGMGRPDPGRGGGQDTVRSCRWSLGHFRICMTRLFNQKYDQ